MRKCILNMKKCNLRKTQSREVGLKRAWNHDAWNYLIFYYWVQCEKGWPYSLYQPLLWCNMRGRRASSYSLIFNIGNFIASQPSTQLYVGQELRMLLLSAMWKKMTIFTSPHLWWCNRRGRRASSYSLIFNIVAPSHLSPRPSSMSDRSWGCYYWVQCEKDDHIHFPSNCDGVTGMVGRHPYYSLNFSIGTSSHLIPRPSSMSDTIWGCYWSVNFFRHTMRSKSLVVS